MDLGQNKRLIYGHVMIKALAGRNRHEYEWYLWAHAVHSIYKINASHSAVHMYIGQVQSYFLFICELFRLPVQAFSETHFKLGLTIKLVFPRTWKVRYFLLYTFFNSSNERNWFLLIILTLTDKSQKAVEKMLQ